MGIFGINLNRRTVSPPSNRVSVGSNTIGIIPNQVPGSIKKKIDEQINQMTIVVIKIAFEAPLNAIAPGVIAFMKDLIQLISRLKNDSGFPYNAIEYCLQEAKARNLKNKCLCLLRKTN